MRLTIVVVTYESANVVEACLRRAVAVGDEVLVVDNASTDDTVGAARALGVTVHVMDRNRGFAAAANAGAARAASEVLCFLNPDCEITAEAWTAARRALAARDVACAVPAFHVGGRVLAGRQSGYTRLKLVADCMEGGIWPAFVPRLVRRSPRHDDASWHWPLGACLFVRKAVFQAVGGFDERYFLYMEDVEFGRALSARGGEVVALPCVVRHEGAKSSDVARSVHWRALQSARLQYAHRHHGAGFARLLALVGASVRRSFAS